MQLKNEEIKIIKNIILKYCQNAKIILFGSRAANTAKTFSDIDLAIITSSQIPLDKLTLIKNDLAESKLLYLVDIVDWHRISADFQKIIIDTGISL